MYIKDQYLLKNQVCWGLDEYTRRQGCPCMGWKGFIGKLPGPGMAVAGEGLVLWVNGTSRSRENGWFGSEVRITYLSSGWGTWTLFITGL